MRRRWLLTARCSFAAYILVPFCDSLALNSKGWPYGICKKKKNKSICKGNKSLGANWNFGSDLGVIVRAGGFERDDQFGAKFYTRIKKEVACLRTGRIAQILHEGKI